MDGEPILKKTMVTMAAMVAACVVFVGALSVTAVMVTSRAVHAGGSDDGSSVLVPADKVEPRSGARAPGGLQPGAPSQPMKPATQI
jgi:hypothetical protein